MININVLRTNLMMKVDAVLLFFEMQLPGKPPIGFKPRE